MKNRYSTKERLEILEELRKSDLSVIKFAREKSIPSSTIFTWLKKERGAKQTAEKALSHKDENALVEIIVPKETNKSNQERNIENKQALVLACNGCAIQISDDFNQDTLKKVLQVVQKL